MFRNRAAIVLLAFAASSSALAQDVSAPMAASYAQMHGVSIAEAQRRLSALDEISEVERKLEERFPNQFGGLFVEHDPAFRVVVKMTGNGQGLLQQITSNPLFTVEKAERPVKQLHQQKARLATSLSAVPGTYAISVNVYEGTIDVMVDEVDVARAALAKELRQFDYIRISELAEPVTARATILGGSRQTDCTAGFTATRSGTDGIVTAGHCDNRSSNQAGVTLSNVAEAYASNDTFAQEWQFMTPVSGTHTFSNSIYRGSGATMGITSTYDADGLPVGWSVCFFGTETNREKCGKTTTKRVFVRDNNSVRYPAFGMDLTSLHGDSGAPVYGGNVAYGMLTSGADSSSYFVDIGDLPLAIPGTSVKIAP